MTTALAELRRSTRELHLATEQELGRGRWLESRSAYAQALALMLGFHQLVEASVGPAADSLPELQYRSRRRSPALRSDLRTVAADGAVAPVARPDRPAEPSTAAPPVRAALVVPGVAGALGCLYVVEGSTLGGRVLVGRIASRLGYDETRGATSFAPYGAATARRWRAFGAVLEQWVDGHPKELPALVQAALSTFAAHRTLVGDGAGASP